MSGNRRYAASHRTNAKVWSVLQGRPWLLPVEVREAANEQGIVWHPVELEQNVAIFRHHEIGSREAHEQITQRIHRQRGLESERDRGVVVDRTVALP